MNTKSISISVLQSFMSPGELADFMDKYQNNRKKSHRLKYVPSQTDLELFNRNPKPTLEEFMAHWGVQKGTATHKLGIIYLSLR